MDIKHKFCLLPELVLGEKTLYFKPWVWGASFKSSPTYRLFFSFPPLWEEGFYITDRRMLIVSSMFRILTQEFSLWFPGKEEKADSELIREVRVGRGRMFGLYVEIVSEDPTKHWYRSRMLRSRFFMREAEHVRMMISEQLR